MKKINTYKLKKTLVFILKWIVVIVMMVGPLITVVFTIIGSTS